MSKSVLISIQPYYVFLIIAKAMGWNIPKEKTIEVRKTIPRDKDWNRKAIIYCSKNKKSFDKIPGEYQPLMESFLGKVIGEFVCDGIISRCEMANADIAEQQGCIKREDLIRYACGKELYGWHISNLKIYDKPKELSEFCVIDKDKLKECPYRERICQNPEFTNGNYLLGGYSCSKTKEPDFDIIDFCRGGCADVFKSLTRPPQSWCYVERLVGEE